MKKYGKFAVLIAIILAVMVWLALAGSGGAKTYYKTVAELSQMGDRAYSQRLRVGGDVATGSIEHHGKQVVFVLKQDKQDLKVVYSGLDPLPDTFRDGAQALAEGKMNRDGTFHATSIQAKCASKYEAKPSLKPGQALPNINSGTKTSI